MRFGAWVRLGEAATMMMVMPDTPGILQVRQETGLVVYPRGKSAMILYAAADDLRGACERLAAEHPGAAWLVRCNRDPVGDPGVEAERLIADFVARFGAAPSPGGDL